MPTNKPARPQPSIKITDVATSAISLEDIKRIAREAGSDAGRVSAREEVQRLLGDEPPTQHMREDTPFADMTATLTPQPAMLTVYPIPSGERRFIAHLPAKEGGLPEQVHGTRNLDTGQVVLDDAQGVYRSWVDFLNACHASGQTPTKIEDEPVA